MPIEVVMPKFGLTMQEGTIQQWFKAEGDAISAGEPLFEVETEKVLYEVESPTDGVVARLLYPAESTVPVATVVAVIAIAGEDPAEVAERWAVAERPAEHAVRASTSSARAKEVRGTPAETARPGSVEGPALSRVEGQAERIIATPAARKLAKERGIDLAQVSGTGPAGRITREDVEAFLAAPPPSAQAVRLQGMRKSIAQRMHQSLQTTAQLTIHTEADVTEMVRHREQFTPSASVTHTDLLIAAVARALRKHPRLNATVEGDAIQLHSDVHLGLAVALDEGLIVPVLRNADRKTVEEIATDRRRLVEQARAGTLQVDEVSGGTFTITNLGMYGIDAFTPILHAPQVAILGVGRIQEKPAVHEGSIQIRHLVSLSLTFDHRAVDGAPAAEFLRAVVRELTRDSPQGQ